jgi:uncharacterized membrane protein (GlpM family)
MFLKYILIFVVGGFTVSAITFLADRGLFRLVGIVVFIPVVSLVSFYFIGREVHESGLQKLIPQTFLSMVPLFFFLVSLHFMLSTFSYQKALFIALLIWIGIAAAISVIGGVK